MTRLVMALLLAVGLALAAEEAVGPFEYVALPYGIAPPGLEYLAPPEPARGVLVEVRLKEGEVAPAAVRVRLRYRRHGETRVRWREQMQAWLWPYRKAALVFTVGPAEVVGVEIAAAAWPEGEEEQE